MLLAVWAALAATPVPAQDQASPELVVPGFAVETVADGLRFPWCLAFLPDGDLLVTERGGTLRRIGSHGAIGEPVAGVPPVYERSQGGLFDALLHPRHGENGLVYLSYAHGPPEANTLRVARARLAGNALTDLKVVFETVPAKDTPVHYGGRMTFLPDGTLLVTTGDGFDYREEAQRLENLFGKTVRIRDDGSVPPDNPYVDTPGARPEIFSYGHRNPQGLVVDRDSGAVYLHEHGPRGGDELNLIEPGRNYGWPVITYGVDYSGARISPYTERPGMVQPLVHWTPSIAPAGMTWYDGDAFPEWRGNLFVSSLVERSVRRVVLADGKVISQTVMFTEFGERIRDVRTGPDGRLYLLTDSEEGRVLAIGR